MSADELAGYRFQLEQVADALTRDPANPELLKLSADLAEVVALFESLAGSSAAPAPAPAAAAPSVGSADKASLSSVQSRDSNHNDNNNHNDALPASSAAGPKRHVPGWMQRSSGSSGSSSSTQQAGVDHDASQQQQQQQQQTVVWRTGDTVLARWTDGGSYEATIVGRTDSGYDVVFTGFDSIESVPADGVSAPLVPASTSTTTTAASDATSDAAIGPAAIAQASSSARVSVLDMTASAQRQHQQQQQQHPKKRKAKRDGLSKGDREQLDKQQAWLKFATAGVKKKGGPSPSSSSSSSAASPAATAPSGVLASAIGAKVSGALVMPLQRKSMFSTPDDPNARVGVIGSGRPMTAFSGRGRHVFSKTE